MTRKILCERKDGSLMSITTTKKVLDIMANLGMIVRAWYEDDNRSEVYGTDIW